MNQLPILSLILTLVLMSTGASASTGAITASDSTLRVDYTMTGNSSGQHTIIGLKRMLKYDGWHGRKVNLDRLPLKGNGNVTLTDAATGDTIYRNAFSTLYQEWLTTEEASRHTRTFEGTALMPLPSAKAVVKIELTDPYGRTIAASTFGYNPTDILVRRLSSDKGNNIPHRTLHRAKNPDRAINIAIVGEGYPGEAVDSFYHDASRTVEAILSHEPFKSRADNFTFTAVCPPSLQPGISIPRSGEWHDTALGSHYDSFYIDRYLTTGEVHALHDALSGIPYDHIIILANTAKYGGAGIYNSYTLASAHHPTFVPVMVHEFGHGFGGLADEYFYEGDDEMEAMYPRDVEPWEPNLTTLNDFASKWEDMLAPGTPVPTPAADSCRYEVGVYEGGGYCTEGVYRPADRCRMRDNTISSFCPVCRRAISSLIDFLTQPQK